MSVDEQKTMNRVENHARSAIISLGMSVQTIVSHELRHGEGFSFPGDCTELSKRPFKTHMT